MRALFTGLVAAAVALASCISGVAQVAAAPAAFSPSQLEGQCAEIYRDWTTQNSPKAFALSGEGTDCGASWNHMTAEEARADALGQCRETGASDCTIVAEDTTPPVSVRVGDVVLIRGCAADYKHWLAQAAPKSFYATADGRSCGSAWNYETQQRASKEARRQCVVHGAPCQEIGGVE